MANFLNGTLCKLKMYKVYTKNPLKCVKNFPIPKDKNGKRFPFVVISTKGNYNRRKVLVIVHVVIGVIALLIGWKFGDWRNLKKYYPTILFFIIGDLLYNIMTYNHPAWMYNKGWIFPNHTLTNLWVMITVYPATVITYLFHFPKRKSKQAFYILFWVILYVFFELLSYMLGFVKYSNGWNMWWSILFGVPPAKRGFTTLRKYKYKKPNFSGVISENLGFSYFRKAPFS